MKNLIIALACLALVLPMNVSAQSVAQGNISKESVEKYSKISKELLANRDKSVPELMIIAAKQMLGTEYVAGSLELVPEQLALQWLSTQKKEMILPTAFVHSSRVPVTVMVWLTATLADCTTPASGSDRERPTASSGR